MRITNSAGALRLRALAAAAALAWAAGAGAASTDHHPDVIMHDGFQDIASGPTNDNDAARFLQQATFGPTLTDIAHLRAVGYDAWLTEQKNAAVSLQVPYLDWVRTLPDGQNSVYQQQRLESWLINSLGTTDPSTGHPVHTDQLRQRMAYALSQIFVVSDQNTTLNYSADTMASFYDLLSRNALGNYRTLLEEVSKHPAMGVYLSSIGNQKPDLVNNIRPDENYAREILQLFSVGLTKLKIDGTPDLDGQGHIQETYTQDTVRGFAHVFTGWNWSDCTVDEYTYCGSPGNPEDAPFRTPMVPFEAYHDEVGPETAGSTHYKQLLIYDGVALPGGRLVGTGTAAGSGAQVELTKALDNIFNHPNVGPFIGKLLIQRLVTSNPSPAYVARVAGKFNNNGSGVRGDLFAVVRQILLDPEARLSQMQNVDYYGKVREPFLRLTNLWRSTKAYSANGRLNMQLFYEGYIGQVPGRSPTVFNFYKPTYQLPGEIRNRGYVSPEFQLFTDTQVVSAGNDFQWHIFYFYPGSTEWFVDVDSILIDSGPAPLGNGDAALAANPDQLLNRYSLLFMSGQMSPFMRDVIKTRLNAMTNTNGGRDRVQHALYLIMLSPEYSAQK